MDWDSAAAAMDTSVAAVFDKVAVTFEPKTKGFDVNAARASEDPNRAPFTRLCSVEREPATMPVSSRPAGDPGVPRDPIQYDAVITAHVAGWPYLPVRGDHAVVGSMRYVIAAVRSDAGRPAFLVNKAG